MARNPKKPALAPPAGPPHKLGYARVSTLDQDMRMQIDALVGAGVDPRDIFKETASGANIDKRPEFQAMMKDIQAGDIVYVWKLDRLARNVMDLHNTIKVIAERGARLVVLTMPGMDTSTPTGKLLFSLLANVAEFERELGRERTIAGLKAARERGRTGGRKPRYTLAQLEQAYAEGGSLRSGAERLGMTLTGFKNALDRERYRKSVEPSDALKAAARRYREVMGGSDD